MKIKDGFIIREAAGSYVVMNLGNEINFNSLITLNETGALIWNYINDGFNEDEIAAKIAEEYRISFETALTDVKAFINKMREADVLE